MQLRRSSRNAARVLPLLTAVVFAAGVQAAPPASPPALNSPAGMRTTTDMHARATSTTALTVASSESASGSAVTLLATVDGRSGEVPGGSVVFTVQGKQIGEVPVAKGAASLTVPALPAGLSSLSATYEGDSNFLPSRSATVRFYQDEQD